LFWGPASFALPSLFARRSQPGRSGPHGPRNPNLKGSGNKPDVQSYPGMSPPRQQIQRGLITCPSGVPPRQCPELNTDRFPRLVTVVVKAVRVIEIYHEPRTAIGSSATAAPKSPTTALSAESRRRSNRWTRCSLEKGHYWAERGLRRLAGASVVAPSGTSRSSAAVKHLAMPRTRIDRPQCVVTALRAATRRLDPPLRRLPKPRCMRIPVIGKSLGPHKPRVVETRYRNLSDGWVLARLRLIAIACLDHLHERHPSLGRLR